MFVFIKWIKLTEIISKYWTCHAGHNRAKYYLIALYQDAISATTKKEPFR